MRDMKTDSILCLLVHVHNTCISFVFILIFISFSVFFCFLRIFSCNKISNILKKYCVYFFAGYNRLLKD